MTQRRIAELLGSLGADLRACDPHVVESPALASCTLVDLTEEELASADLVVVLTDHDSFDFEWIGTHAQHVLDCRRASGIPGAEIL